MEINTVVKGSEGCGPNGVEISADGQWCFLNWWDSDSHSKRGRTQPRPPIG